MRGSGNHRHPLPPELLAALAGAILPLGAFFLVGAILPRVLSVYLLDVDPILLPALAATAIVTLVVHRAARPVRGLGTLIGGDLLHLREVRAMAPAVAPIGGAGTFDGIFLSGILAVLLVGFTS